MIRIVIKSKSKASHSSVTRRWEPFASTSAYGDLFQGTPERYCETIPVD